MTGQRFRWSGGAALQEGEVMSHLTQVINYFWKVKSRAAMHPSRRWIDQRGRSRIVHAITTQIRALHEDGIDLYEKCVRKRLHCEMTNGGHVHTRSGTP